MPEFDIPKECKAGVVHNEGPDFELKVEMVPVPEPGPDDILVKLNATGICFSDVHFLLNDLAPMPMSNVTTRRSYNTTKLILRRLLRRQIARA